MIHNPTNIPIQKSEIFPNVFSYTLPATHHFESYGTNFGQTIYGGEVLENPYQIKPNEDTTNNTTTNIDNDK